jgi:sarcosine oxidase subunit gamma
MVDAAVRTGAFASLAANSRPCPAAELRPLPPEARFIFRGRGDAVVAAGRALGFALPEAVCRAAVADSRAALWLGPDEWLLIVPETQEQDFVQAAATALAGLPHALVAVGHRNSAVELSGTQAAIVLAAGCPLDLDLDSFPAGMCTRTVLGKAEIILWRSAPQTFRIEVWRSFAAYVWRFLDEARGEFR